MTQTKTYYTSRSQAVDYRRCPRLRWLSHYEGSAGMGLEPRRKSLHLVIGLAVHAGMEVLLREGQAWLDSNPTVPGPNDREMPATLSQQLEYMFVQSSFTTDGKPIARRIENIAVEAALADLAKEFGDGVELDPEEAAAKQGAVVGMEGLLTGQGKVLETSINPFTDQPLDSPIEISFDGLIFEGLTPDAHLTTGVDLTGSYGGIPRTMTLQTDEEFLREELAALVEGMVRTWARRRWRETLEQFQVLEVEREGEWKLGEIETAPHPIYACLSCDWEGEKYNKINGILTCPECSDQRIVEIVQHEWIPSISSPDSPWYATCAKCQAIRNSKTASESCSVKSRAEIRFQSRHDALLLERSTGYLYLQSYKTTGKWDRRKEMDAQVDMQGLTEAVDVERRLGEAWKLVHGDNLWKDGVSDADKLVNISTARWLHGLTDPPRILGIRYDYLLKGDRKRDKKDPLHPDRYVFQSILCRAWKQEGITSDDRRWSWTWDWFDGTGKGRRLDYRSWHKAAVWQQMTVAEWIDMLDQGKVQEGALDEQGEALDSLGEQLLPIITIFRSEDDARDCLEQLAAQEEMIARGVEEVRAATAEGGEAAKRSALNRLFPQNRSACSYPGICQYRSTPTKPGLCFAGAMSAAEAEVGGDFRQRQPNHPIEGLKGLVQIDGN